MKYKDIARKYGVSLSTVKSWKTRYKWTRTKSAYKRGAGAPFGNKNAVGNRGGPGGPPGNKKAVTTGEFETIWFSVLSTDEKDIVSRLDINHQKLLDDEIRLITIREHRMMRRIQDLIDGLSEKQRRIFQERQITKEQVQYNNDVTGETKSIVIAVPSLVVKSIDETEFRKIDDILKLEDALTRVQDKKIRLLALKHNTSYDAAMLLLKERELALKEF